MGTASEHRLGLYIGPVCQDCKYAYTHCRCVHFQFLPGDSRPERVIWLSQMQKPIIEIVAANAKAKKKAAG